MFEQVEPAKLELPPTRAAVSIVAMVFLVGVYAGILIGRQKWDVTDLALMGFMVPVSSLTVYRLLPSLTNEKQHGH